MHKIKVILDTTTDVVKFVNTSTSIEEPVYLEDGNGFRADAKSLMGVMYGMTEFKDLYVVSDYEHLETKFRSIMI